MTVVDFTRLNKLTAKSFNDQKALIKKVLAGRIIKCASCKTVLKFTPPSQDSKSSIYCDKGCTDIELDLN